jgi:hypothetical protein
MTTITKYLTISLITIYQAITLLCNAACVKQQTGANATKGSIYKHTSNDRSSK